MAKSRGVGRMGRVWGGEGGYKKLDKKRMAVSKVG